MRIQALKATIWIDRQLGAIELLFLWLACSCMTVMLAINIANLAYRNITGKGISWVWAWTGLLFVWAVFLCFFVMYRRNLDIRITYFLERMNKTFQTGVHILSASCTIGVVALIVIESPEIFKRQVGVLDFVGFERYALSIPLLLSSALLLIHFLNELARLLLAPALPARTVA